MITMVAPTGLILPTTSASWAALARRSSFLRFFSSAFFAACSAFSCFLCSFFSWAACAFSSFVTSACCFFSAFFSSFFCFSSASLWRSFSSSSAVESVITLPNILWKNPGPFFSFLTTGSAAGTEDTPSSFSWSITLPMSSTAKTSSPAPSSSLSFSL